MNDYFSAAILGLVQGLTEFLPVSSSGHLALLEAIGVGEESMAFNLALHAATLLAVIVFFRKKLLYLVKHPKDWRVSFILIASVPTAAMAVVVRYFIPQTRQALPFCFLLTAAILILPTIFKPALRSLDVHPVKKALLTGFAQGIACFNGISRSGTTVSALTLIGANPEDSAELSFLLSIPIILGSSVVEFATGNAHTLNIGAVCLGGAIAFVVGLFAIRIFIKLLKKQRLWVFSIYTFLLGIGSFFLLF